MVLLLLAFIRLLRTLRASANDPQFQALGLAVCLLLIIGTMFYSTIEKWSILDSFYFSVVTLATIGYGDFVPNTDIGKMFTIIYIFIGVGTLVSFVTLLATKMKRRKTP